MESLNDFSIRVSNCSACEGSKELVYGTLPMAGRGLPTAKLAFVSEKPSILETKIGEPISDSNPAGAYFWKAIEENGIIPDNVYVTCLVKCCVSKARKTHMMTCSDLLFDELNIIQPEKVFLMGKQVTNSVMRDSRFERFNLVPTVSLHGLYNGGQQVRKAFSKVLRGKQK